jgi:hypothetical protein
MFHNWYPINCTVFKTTFEDCFQEYMILNNLQTFGCGDWGDEGFAGIFSFYTRVYLTERESFRVSTYVQ